MQHQNTEFANLDTPTPTYKDQAVSNTKEVTARPSSQSIVSWDEAALCAPKGWLGSYNNGCKFICSSAVYQWPILFEFWDTSFRGQTYKTVGIRVHDMTEMYRHKHPASQRYSNKGKHLFLQWAGHLHFQKLFSQNVADTANSLPSRFFYIPYILMCLSA